MLAMARPTYFMPVHGEAMHLREHAQLARQMGIPDERIFVVDNGDTLVMADHKVRLGEPIESGIVYVDGLSVTDADPVVLRDRQRLSNDGVITCMVTISHRSRKARGVEVYSRGVSFPNDGEVTREAQEAVRRCVDDRPHEDVGVAQIRRDVRRALSNLIWDKTRTRPMILSFVIEV